jgi:hypothetical protein
MNSAITFKPLTSPAGMLVCAITTKTITKKG